MNLRGGERVRVRTVDDEGIPIVRYGTVASDHRGPGPVPVLFDDLAGGDLVDISEVTRVDFDTVELHMSGTDLLDDQQLRSGLATMWCAEARLAGLTVNALFPMGDDGHGVSDQHGGWMLAEFTVHGTAHVVRATPIPDAAATVVVRADRVDHWDGYF